MTDSYGDISYRKSIQYNIGMMILHNSKDHSNGSYTESLTLQVQGSREETRSIEMMEVNPTNTSRKKP